MSKKATSKAATPAQRATKPAPKKAPATRKVATIKPTKPVKAVRPKTNGTRKPAPAPLITTDDIALRAYYIAETRRQRGLPGDEHQDWIEAERQLVAESKPVKKAVRPKSSAK